MTTMITINTTSREIASTAINIIRLRGLVKFCFCSFIFSHCAAITFGLSPHPQCIARWRCVAQFRLSKFCKYWRRYQQCNDVMLCNFLIIVPPAVGGIKRYRDPSVRPSVCPMAQLPKRAAALGNRHAGCLQLSHGRTADVDPPRVELPSAGGTSSSRPRGTNLFISIFILTIFAVNLLTKSVL